jgi:hypothetical protein
MHDGLISESKHSRIEAEECLRKANSCDDNQDRSAWRVLAESWLLLAEINESQSAGRVSKQTVRRLRLIREPHNPVLD